MHSCWIEISRSALQANIRQIQIVAGERQLICVVKANAYGCGAVECVRILQEAGASYFAVTRLEEALPLRAAGITAPILLLAPVLGDEELVLTQDLTATFSAPEDAQRLAATAAKLNRVARGHVKIDSGMGRFGLTPDELDDSLSARAWPESVEYEGIFTHFPDAGSADRSATERQAEIFNRAVIAWSKWRMPRLIHSANSATLIRFPFEATAARPGTLLYGQFPTTIVSEEGKKLGIELKDVFHAKARILALRKVKSGSPIGYGSEWKAPKDSVIAILACGYADGLSLEPRARTESPISALRAGAERAARLVKQPQSGRLVTVLGQKAPIVGRIAMQTCAIDVTAIPAAQLGDEVLVPMRRVTAGGHLPRIYVD